AAGARLDRRHHVVERLLEHLDRVLLGLALDDLERAVDDRLGHRLLALVHDRIHELGDHHVREFRIGEDLALVGTVTAGHETGPWSSLLSSWPGSSRPSTSSFSLLRDPRVSLRSPGDTPQSDRL